MDLITLIAVLLIVFGLVLLVAGLMSWVNPEATRVGGGLLLLGVLVLVIALVIAEADVDSDRGAVFGPLGFLWHKWHRWSTRSRVIVPPGQRR
jgi:hypothetical protein